jgi:hypothetical protein
MPNPREIKKEIDNTIQDGTLLRKSYGGRSQKLKTGPSCAKATEGAAENSRRDPPAQKPRRAQPKTQDGTASTEVRSSVRVVGEALLR